MEMVDAVGGDGVVIVEPPDTRPEDTVDSMRSSAWVVRDSVYVGWVGDVRGVCSLKIISQIS